MRCLIIAAWSLRPLIVNVGKLGLMCVARVLQLASWQRSECVSVCLSVSSECPFQLFASEEPERQRGWQIARRRKWSPKCCTRGEQFNLMMLRLN